MGLPSGDIGKKKCEEGHAYKSRVMEKKMKGRAYKSRGKKNCEEGHAYKSRVMDKRRKVNIYIYKKKIYHMNA